MYRNQLLFAAAFAVSFVLAGQSARAVMFAIDVDSTNGGTAIDTAPDFNSLDGTGGNGSSLLLDGVTFAVFSADDDRNRAGGNDLTKDFIFDDGVGQAVGLTVTDLPAGLWRAEVWSWDNSFPTTVGDQIVGITQFGPPEIIFTNSFTPDPDDPFVFTFDSTGLANGFGIFTRENNSANRARFNALRLTAVPEPATATLGLLGMCGLMARRRKRH